MVSGIPWEGLIPIIGLVLSTVVTFFKSFAFVKEGELGIKLRFGKAVRSFKTKDPKIIQTGFVIMIPWVETLVRRHVRQDTVHIQRQNIVLKDNLIYSLSAVVLFRVKDIYKALFEIEDLEYAIDNLAQSILRENISQKTHEDLSDIKNISADLLKDIKPLADDWGVEFIKFSVTDSSPTEQSAQLILL